MKKDKKNNDDAERLRKENEEKRENLIRKTGCEFFIPEEGKKLDPFIENQFLNNIEEFEEAFENCKQISIYDFIGRPEFRKLEDIPESELESELKKLYVLFNNNSISLDCLCEVDNSVLYRFITEEFFNHKMDDVRIKGMMHCFTYEEFHPNHRYDIENYCEDFITGILNLDNQYFDSGIIDENGFKTRLVNFRNAFSGFTINEFRVLSVNFDSENGTTEFYLDFIAVIDEETNCCKYSGNGKVEVIFRYDYWYISSVELHGLKKM